MEYLFDDDKKEALTDLGLLALRAFTGLAMFFGHGLGKLKDFSGQVAARDGFMGMPGELAATLLISAEALCALLIAVGLATRFAAVPLFIAMMVAAFVAHGGDPFADKELALFYGTASLTIILTGPGKYSVDRLIESYLKSK